MDSLNSLKGFVEIDNIEKAIEFVRFNTSGHTYFLFNPNIMVEVYDRENKKGEIYPYGSCPSGLFHKYNLKNLQVKVQKDYFEVRRYLLFSPWNKDAIVNYDKYPILYRVVEEVYKDGTYKIDKTEIMRGIELFEIPHPLPPR